MRGYITTVVSALFLVVNLLYMPITAFGEETNEINLAPEASSAVLIERDTGTVLYEKNSEEQLPPASMTKIMTMLLIMEAIDQKKLALDDKVRTSERAASMGGSQIFLEPGEEMTVKDMLKAIAVASGNDASVAMAEHLAGSEDEFVKRMNQKAQDLGLSNTNFINSNGLPAENHYTTAMDLAVISKELLKYDGITEFTGIYEDYLRQDTEDKFWLVNTNKLVKFYPGVDGLKTGYTREAKYCLTATAQKNGMRVIAVVMGAPTPKERNSQITNMLDYAFSQYTTHKLYDRDHVIGEVKVSKGNKEKVEAVTAETISILTKRGESVEEAEEKVLLNEKVQAPIKQGEQIGSLIIEKDGKVLSDIALLAKEDIIEASWWNLFKRTLGKFSGK